MGLRPLPQSGAAEPEPGDQSARRGYARVGLGGGTRSPLRPEYALPGLRPGWFTE